MSHLTCPACGGHLTVIHAGVVETHARVPTFRRDDPWQTVRTLRLADFAACDRCEWIEELSTTNSGGTRCNSESSPADVRTAAAASLTRKD
jgi:hypothetical protein